MKTKPILFNTEMVQAILDGKKNKTTRVFSKTQLKYFDYAQKLGEMSSLDNLHENDFAYILQFSQYKVGDVLWVREPVKVTKACNDTLKMEFEYLSDGTKKIIDIPKKYLDEYDFIKNNCFLAKLNQLHYDKKYVGVPNGCLKEMARIFLKVTKVRIERLQDMKNNDYLLEGVDKNLTYKYLEKKYPQYMGKYSIDKIRFIELWNSTSKDGYKWEDNPYVFVYEFEKVKNEK